MSLSKIFSYNFNISRGSIIASNNSNTVGSIFTTGGNIGINTTNPLTRLHINGNSLISGDVTIGSNLIVTGPSLQIPTGNIAARPGVPQNGSIRYNTETQQFEGYGPGGAWGSLGGVIDIAQTTKILASATPSTTDGNLYFLTTNAERMRINSAGNIGIGTTAPSVLLDVAGTSRFTNSVVTNSTITNLTLVNSSISSLTLSNSIDLSTVTQFSGSFSAANNVNVATDVTGFQLSNSVYGCFTSTLNVRITTSTGQLNSQVYMEATQNTSGWLLNDSTLGDSTGITFTLNSSGQLQYTSTNQPNWISTTFTYLVNGIKLSSGLTQSIQTSGNAIISGNLTILNTTDIGGSSTPSLAIAGGLSVDKRSFFNNNVGIGTTNPTFNLDVIGIARITDSITTGGLEITGLTDTLNLTATNITSSTLNLSTGLTTGISRITTNLIAIGNSNTIGNIFTTGGNVGIGINNPSSLTKLHVNGDIGIPYGSNIRVGPEFTGWPTTKLIETGWDINGMSGDTVSIYTPGASTGNGTSRINIASSGIINLNGNVGIGTKSPATTLHVQFASGRAMIGGLPGYPPFGAECTVNSAVGFLYNLSSTTPQGLNIYYNGVSNGGGSNYIWCNDATRLNFVVAGNGNVQNVNNSYGAISDIKLKENIIDTTPKLNDLMKVKIRNYNLIGDSIKQIGIIAQELEPIFPSLIEETKDMDKNNNDLGTTTKAIKYSVFVPILIKSIQEQQEIINELTSKINFLLSRIETLEKR